jgi:hypothetical protein
MAVKPWPARGEAQELTGLTIRANARGKPHHKAGDAPFQPAIDLGFRMAEQISSAPPNSVPSLTCIS